MPVPNIWTDGDKLFSSALNQNFEYLCNLVTNAPDLITALNERITDLEIRYNELEQRVIDLETP